MEGSQEDISSGTDRSPKDSTSGVPQEDASFGGVDTTSGTDRSHEDATTRRDQVDTTSGPQKMHNFGGTGYKKIRHLDLHQVDGTSGRDQSQEDTTSETDKSQEDAIFGIVPKRCHIYMG